MNIRKYLSSTALFTTLLALYTWPLLWNGFPLVYYDTASYLSTAFDHVAYVWQSPGYGTFIHICMFFVHDIYFIPYVQAAILITALWFVGSALHVRSKTRAIILVALGILTPLPILACTLLPDSLFAAGFITLIGTLCIHKSLHRLPKVPLVLLVLTIAVHLASGAIFIASIGITTACMWFAISRAERIRHASLIVMLIGIFFVTSVDLYIMYPAVNYASWSATLNAQLADEGLLYRYLSQNCHDHHYSLCGYPAEKITVDADQFLWDQNGVFMHDLGGWSHIPSDFPELAIHTIQAYPTQFACGVITRTFKQLRTYAISYEYHAIADDQSITDSIRNYYGEQTVHEYTTSRQKLDWFGHMPTIWLRLYACTAALSMITPLIAALYIRRTSAYYIVLMLYTSLVVNAATMSALSHVHNRYQLRIVYIPLYVSLMLLASTTRKDSDRRT